MKDGDAHTLSVGDMFTDGSNIYRIAGDALEEEGIKKEHGIYFVRDFTNDRIIKKSKDFFQPLKYIGSYDFSTDTVTPVGATPVGGKSRRRRHKTRQTKRRKHRKSKSRRHRR